MVFTSFFKLFFTDHKVKYAIGNINANHISLTYQANGTAVGSFGGNMSNGRSIGAAGKASVGEKSHIFTKSHTGDGRCGGKHFAHAGATARAFVGDDHAVTLLDFAG